MSWAILSRVAAVGVGFLLNSNSRVTSWSWVARCRLLFFCCWVRVLFRGGLREAEVGTVFTLELDGDGVEVVEDGEVTGFKAAAEEARSGISVEDMVAVIEGRVYNQSSDSKDGDDPVDRDGKERSLETASSARERISKRVKALWQMTVEFSQCPSPIGWGISASQRRQKGPTKAALTKEKGIAGVSANSSPQRPSDFGGKRERIRGYKKVGTIKGTGRRGDGGNTDPEEAKRDSKERYGRRKRVKRAT